MNTPAVNPYESPPESSGETTAGKIAIPGAVLLTSGLIYCGCMSLMVYSIVRLLDGFESWLMGILLSSAAIVLQSRAVIFRDGRSSSLVGAAVIVAAVLMLVPSAAGYAPARFLVNSAGVTLALVILPQGIVMLWWANRIRLIRSTFEPDQTA